MEASEVKISSETWDLNKVSPSKKRKLREQAVLDLIKSKPNLTPIKTKDFAVAARLNDVANAWNFLKGMERRGLIKKVESGPAGMVYTINDAARTVKPAVKKVKSKERELGEEVERLAKDYLWEAEERGTMFGTTLLKDFVKWVKTQ